MRMRLPLSKTRLLTEQDRAAWSSYAQHVSPLPGRTRPAPPVLAAGDAAPAAIIAPTSTPRRAGAVLAELVAELAAGQAPAGLDGANWQRFRSGKLGPGRTLDLHGHTAQTAHLALTRFLHQARADELRCVDIITGRGKGQEGGTLRREVPLWLNLPPLRPLLLAITHPPRNPGALRVLLRRAR